MREGLRQIQVPHLIRLKSGALRRLPIYLARESFTRALLMHSEGLPEAIMQPVLSGFEFERVENVADHSEEALEKRMQGLPAQLEVVVGLGGGKALDVAKLTASRRNLPYIAVPTSLSNDGFCSPTASLLSKGKRATFEARLPTGVVLDLEVVKQAPKALWLSGVGDLVAKWTAIHDWKLAFHHDGTPFDDLSALLSDASVFQFLGHPSQDFTGIKLLAQALLLNGVAMEMAGCSRPASGSEHLISHALDQISTEPRLHGLQVGLATYWIALLQGQDVSNLDRLFQQTGFWKHLQEHPMKREDWTAALQAAPTIKKDFHTVLSHPTSLAKAADLLQSEQRLRECLV